MNQQPLVRLLDMLEAKAAHYTAVGHRAFAEQRPGLAEPSLVFADLLRDLARKVEQLAFKRIASDSLPNFDPDVTGSE